MCRIYGKRSDYARVCKSKENHKQSVNLLNEMKKEENILHTSRSKRNRKRLRVTVEFGKIRCPLIVDTGSGTTILNKEVVTESGLIEKVKPTDEVWKGYGEIPIDTMGGLELDMTVGGKTFITKAIVTK